MKKKISVLVLAISIVGASFFTFMPQRSEAKVQTAQCWFDYGGCCDTGGWVACGVCSGCDIL